MKLLLQKTPTKLTPTELRDQIVSSVAERVSLEKTELNELQKNKNKLAVAANMCNPLER